MIVRGFNFDSADRIYNLSESLYEGTRYESQREVIIGKELKKELDIGIGDELSVILADGKVNKLKVSGFYDLGVASINKAWLLTDLNTAQRMFDYGDRVTSIEITTNNVFEADAIARDIRHRLDNEDLKIEDWKE